jgi:hypothetical protein
MIPYVGNFVQNKPSNYISTSTVPQPPVTLLINNYVKSPQPNLIDPSLVHRLPAPKPRQKGPLSTMLDLVPSRIRVPQHGAHELPKPRVLPSISK